MHALTVTWVDSYEFGEDFLDLRADPEQSQFWAHQLAREVGPGHLLFGRHLDLVVKWLPQDEILVQSGEQVALVHLTFSSTLPAAPPYPRTVFLASAQDFESEFEYR